MLKRRFVILRHDHPTLHWDFMLETAGVLKTWRWPTPYAGTFFAEALPDHRLEYLEYEGPVSGGRGSVRCWDRGVYEMEGPAQARLIGDILRCRAAWSPDGDRWLFVVTDGVPLAS